MEAVIVIKLEGELVVRNVWISVILAVGVLLVPAAASAHVVVTPGMVSPGATTIFRMSVPNERQTIVTQVKLTIPSGVSEVTPTVHPGWTITTQKSGDTISSISWGGGQIPAGQRDDFTFNAIAPADAGTLNWKAYETYSDGTLVSWDQTPNGTDNDNPQLTSGPYSVTKVQDNSAASGVVRNDHANLALLAAAGAIVLSLWSALRARHHK